MVIAFANNQTLVLIGAGTTTVYTDPVPLGNSDRLTAVSNVHAIGATAGSFAVAVLAQVSNDGGQSWFDTALSQNLTLVELQQSIEVVNGELIRFRYQLSNGAGGATVSFITFDLHVRLDHA